MRRKGELSKHAIDKGWPYQVPLVDAGLGSQYRRIVAFCRGLSLCPRRHGFVADGKHHRVYCFAVKDHAEAFAAEFGSALLDPKDRPRWPGKARRKRRQ